jgi:phage-related protein (TIGR01555 family)
MANGWGGARPNSGPKRRKPPKPANDEAPAPAQLPAEPKRRLASFDQVMRLVERAQETARRRPRTRESSPFRIASHPEHAMPPEKARQMAFDDGLLQNCDWATSAWLQGSSIGTAVSEGMAFLGYPYLSELAQRPEYRTVGETIATEMTRKWIRFKGKGDTDKSEKIDELADFLDEIQLRDRMSTACLHDAFFGRSHIYLDCGKATPDELKAPIGTGRRDKLTKTKVGKKWLRGLRNIEPLWVYPMTYNAQDPLSPDWYNPQVWYVMGKEIHRSRIPTFIGRPVPDLLKPAYSFGGLSMSQMLQPYVDIWLQTRESVAELIHTFSTMVLSTDLSSRLMPQGGGTGDVLARVALYNAVRDNQGTMVIDKEREALASVAVPLSGLDHLQAQAQEHIMSVARIPAVKFTGIQPTGLNASSEGEMRAFNDTIHAYQPKLLGPNLDFIIDIAQISLWGEVDDDIVYEWVPLESMSEKEEAELRKLEAETGQIHIDSGVLSQEEERRRIATDPRSLYPGLDPDDVPELLQEEEQGLVPEGAGKGLEAVLGEQGGAPGAPQPPKKPKPPGGGGGADEALDALEGLLGEDAAEWEEGKHPRDEGGKFSSSGSSGGGGTSSAVSAIVSGKAPKPPPRNIGATMALAGLKRVGEQMGSNPGGVFEDEAGKRFYIKKGKSKEHVTNEMVAAALYGLAGTPTLHYRPIEGGTHVATAMAKLDKNNAHKFDENERRQAAKDFAVHAWLGNWDAVGLGGDNLGTVRGKPTALDVGGALEFRAQGSPKGAPFGKTVGEIDTLRDKKMNADAAKIFGSMTPVEMRESARYVTEIPEAEIRATVEKMGGSPALAAKLIARQKDIAERAKTFGSDPDPAKASSSVVFAAGEKPPVKALNGDPVQGVEAAEGLGRRRRPGGDRRAGLPAGGMEEGRLRMPDPRA